MKRLSLLGVMAVALLVRGVAHLTVAPAVPTTWESEEIAVNLVEGRGFACSYLGTVYRAYKPPLYELLCAGIYRVAGHHWLPVRLMQWGFGALLAGTVTLIARRGWGNRLAIAAGMMTALHPALVFYDTHQLAALTLAAWLIAMVILMGLWTDERPTGRRLALLGAAIGLAMYERGTAGILLPLSVAWLWWRHRALGWRRVMGPVVVGWLIVLAPWLARNVLVYHRLVGMTSLTGELLWRGNHPGATGTAVTTELIPILHAASPEFLKRLEGLGELQQQTVFRQEAFAFLRARPWEALQLFARKLGYFWWFAPTSGYRYPPAYLAVYRVLYGGLLLSAIVGLWYGFPRAPAATRAVAGMIVMAGLGLSLAQALYYVEVRHRWVVEPLMIMLSVWGLERMAVRRAYHSG